jgi:bacteriocin biosynthesis cyclodehydratase domain-containing protein
MTVSGNGAGTPNIQILADGRFGDAVAGGLVRLLTMSGRTARVVSERPRELSSFLAADGLAIYASWRDVAAEFEEFADAAKTAQRPWLPVAFSHPHIRVGPAVVPGLAPCYACYSIRVRQHSWVSGLGRDADLEQALNGDRQLGVEGFPPHVAAMAAGLTLAMLGAAAGQAQVGQVGLIDCDTDSIRLWQVVPVDACPVCGATAPAAEARAKAARESLLGVASQATGMRAVPGRRM